MCLTKFLIIILCMVEVKCVNDVSLNDYERYKSCVNNYTNSNPFLAERFSLLQLTKSCKRYDVWKSTSKVPLNTSDTKVFTNAQKKYMDRLQYCRNFMDCYGDTMPRRNHNSTYTRNKRQTAGSRAVRRECRTLSRRELQTYFNTLNKLKTTWIDSTSKYDLIVGDHLPSSAPEAHFGPGFLPYHRELLKQLEVAGKRENPSFALCYWDSRLDHDLPNPADSVLWTDEFFGNGDGYVTSGPFANWRTTTVLPNAGRGRLFREVGQSKSTNLYSHRDVERILAKTTFEDLATYCRDPMFEILHAGVHDFIGGFMTFIPASPNDPVFFTHHCFIDHIWQMWRENTQTPQQQVSDYPTDQNACGVDYHARAQMKPFNIRIIDGLSNAYLQLYSYADAPTCNNDCNGMFLFCNTQTRRCMSKIRPGGNCMGLERFDSCYNSVCVRGRCLQYDAAVQPPQHPPVRQSVPTKIVQQRPDTTMFERGRNNEQTQIGQDQNDEDWTDTGTTDVVSEDS